jgi:hypothetical protein
MDFSAGVIGYSQKFYFGFAAHHLTEPNESLVVGTSRLPMKYTGHIGGLFPFKRSFKGETSYLSPNILYRRQGEFQQLNFGTYVNKGPIVQRVFVWQYLQRFLHRHFGFKNRAFEFWI